ncbi:MAG TPA: GreA/GreB family elongation factor [Bacillota bacterium]|nr:GreA/GreB family elongation factor [Bacillota bacterium]
MAKVALSQPVFEYLVKHLVEIEEGRNKLLDEFSQRPSKERKELENLLENYVKRIDELIRKVKKSPKAGNELPFVTMGCEVEIQNLSDREVHKYRIVTPFRGSVKEGDISYLSPVGKSLLLKKVGDEVEVKAPAGVFHYKIKSIRSQCDVE